MSHIRCYQRFISVRNGPGEIELTGRITKIGGLNYKLIGSKKAGCKLIF